MPTSSMFYPGQLYFTLIYYEYIVASKGLDVNRYFLPCVNFKLPWENKMVDISINNSYNQIRKSIIFSSLKREKKMASIVIDCTDWKYEEIRGLIMLRDRNKCTKCGTTNRLEVHHKNGRKDNTPDSLITLCENCHKEEHSVLKYSKSRLFIRKVMEDAKITISYDIAPKLGITQSAVTQLLQKSKGNRLGRIIAITSIVNTLAKTNYTIQELFSEIPK